MKNRKHTKIIFSLLLALIIAMLFTLPTFAIYDAEGLDEAESFQGSYEKEAESTVEEAEFQNIFDMVYDTLYSNADKIFSLLSFVASLIIAFIYKKNLIPTVKGTVSTLAGSVSELREETGKEVKHAGQLIEKVNLRLLDTEEKLASLTDELSEIEGSLTSLIKGEDNGKKIKTVMEGQIDMLYEIFMASSLPQYQKDAVGEKVRDMKKALSTEENNG